MPCHCFSSLLKPTLITPYIVGSFIVQDETTQSITEALTIIKQWNPQWKPSYFMTDLCEEEINSIETIFPGNFMLPKYIYFVIKNLNTIHTFYAIFSHVNFTFRL